MTRGHRREHGHVIAVNVEKQGDTITADTAEGATTIPVADVCDFDESGGTVQIDGVLYAYSTCDDDASTVTLTAPLQNDVEATEPIYVWDTTRLSVVVEYIAQVHSDGDEEGDPIEASVAAHLIKELPSGIRSLIGEAVLLEFDEDDDEWRVIDVLGIDRDTLGVKFTQDTFTLTEAGTQEVSLTYAPVENSEHVYWNGLYQRQGTSWSRLEQDITISDPDDFIQPGDVIDVEYSYLDGSAQVPAEADDGAVPWVDAVAVHGANILGWWRQGEASGTTMVDSSGNNHDGTYGDAPVLGSTPLVTGDPTTSTLWSNGADYATVNYGSWMNVTPLTILAVVKTVSFGSNRFILTRDEGGTGIAWYINAGKLYFHRRSPFVSLQDTTTNVADGLVHLVAAIHDGTQIRLNVDGVDVASIADANALPTVTERLLIGGSNIGANLEGNMQELLYVADALTESELADLYASVTGAS